MSLALYKIADVMQVPLHINGKEVSGQMQLHFNGALNSLSLPFTVTAKKMFDYLQVGVLYHVRAKLYILVAYNTEHAATSFFVIDAGKCEADGVGISPERLMGSKLNLRETIDQFGKAVVKAFAMRTGGLWQEFTVK